MPAASAAKFESLGSLVSRHHAATRLGVATLAFAVLIVTSGQESTHANPEPVRTGAWSILPDNIGAGIHTQEAVTVSFGSAMDPASVAASLRIFPAQPIHLAWDQDRTELRVSASRLWRTDERYVLVVGADARRADGSPLGGAQRFAFTTQTAPAVSDFQIRLAHADLTAAAPTGRVAEDGPLIAIEEVDLSAPAQLPPTEAALDVSATTAIRVAFSTLMNADDVERHFAITPQVSGRLSWEARQLVFRPTERLVAGTRYTISLVGAHDRVGNPLGGKANFSFTVRPGAQLIRVRPGIGETNAQPDVVELWFSQPMETGAVQRAFAVIDTLTGSALPGRLTWNSASTQLTFRPDGGFAQGRLFEVRLTDGARDADGNPVARTYGFTTLGSQFATPVAQLSTRTPVVPAAAPATTLAGYALNQVNAARAAYGFAPLVLDAAISAVAAAHAWDQARNGYFSHVSLDGRTRDDRLRAGGVSFGWSGENQCYLVGSSHQATLDWCHAQFMAEPYPGQFNHIANILNPNARRMGVGIADVGGRVVITWNFAD